MKRFIIALSFGLIFIACERNSNDTITNKEDIILPVKILVEENGNSRFLTFKYNGNKLKEVIDTEESSLYYTYEGNLIKSIKKVDRSGGYYLYTYGYNSDEKLIYSTKQYTNMSGVKGSMTEKSYTYISSTEVDMVEKEGSKESNFKYILDEQGQIIENIKGDGKKTIYTYDNKNGIFKNIEGVDKVELSEKLLSSEYGGVFNNILNKDSEVYNYEYNQKGYPIRMISNNSNEKYTITFIYNK